MTRYFAFLRAINVGGHTVKMEALRAHFEGLGFAGVSTFIASGNVIFEAAEQESAEIERGIEARLAEQLGYPVSAFVRTGDELAAIVGHEPFPGVDLEAKDNTLYVVFLHTEPGEEVRESVLSLRSSLDDFHILGREIYWLSRGKISESPVFIRGLLDKATRVPGTSRNLNTIHRLVAKYSRESGLPCPPDRPRPPITAHPGASDKQT